MASTVTKYQKRISGPLLDRIDIHVEVPRARFNGSGDPSPAGINSAGSARACNADMHPAEVRRFCQLDDTVRALMKIAMVQHSGLSPRPSARLSPGAQAGARHRRPGPSFVGINRGGGDYAQPPG